MWWLRLAGYRYAFPFLPGATKFQTPGAAQPDKSQEHQGPITADGCAALQDLSCYIASEGQHVQVGNHGWESWLNPILLKKPTPACFPVECA